MQGLEKVSLAVKTLRIRKIAKIFAIFQHRATWQWEQLPQPYLQSAYLSADSDVLTKHFPAWFEAANEQQVQQSSEVAAADDQLSPEGAHEQQVPDSREVNITDDLPKQLTMTIISYMYIRYPTINITILFTGLYRFTVSPLRQLEGKCGYSWKRLKHSLTHAPAQKTFSNFTVHYKSRQTFYPNFHISRE